MQLPNPFLPRSTLQRSFQIHIHLNIDPTVPPHWSWAYPIPHSQLQLFKNKHDCLVKIGVLKPTSHSAWISGSFIIPKKDMTVQWISDFPALNEALKRKVYPIPRIQDILLCCSGCRFLTKLDISMQYYTFVLDCKSQELCTIATPLASIATRGSQWASPNCPTLLKK